MNQGTYKHKQKPIKTTLDTIHHQSMQIKFIEKRANRAWCKERGIRISGSPKGRKPQNVSKETKKQAVDDERIRNTIEGKFGQAFPDYGPERTGAPIRGFTRISDEQIRIHSAVQNPEVVVVLDETLLDAVDIVEGTDENGIIISEFYSDAIESQLYIGLLETIKEHLFLLKRMQEEKFKADYDFFTIYFIDMNFIGFIN